MKNKILYLLITASILFFINFSINNVNKNKEEQQLNALKDAVKRSAVQCYAIEGFYPPNVNYLVNNYGLIVDSEKYVVSYLVFAENIMPEIEVFIK